MEHGFEALQLGLLATFVVLFIGRSVQLRLAQGVRVVTLVRGKPWPEAALETLFLVSFPLWLLDTTWHAAVVIGGSAPITVDPQLFEPKWTWKVGALLEVAALLLFAASLRSFGSSWRVGVDRDRPGGLVTDGIFSLSRNPIFLSMDLVLVGAVLTTGRLVPLVFALGALVGFHRQILVEERLLARRYGRAYRAYRARVGRYVGVRSQASDPKGATP